MSKQNSPVDEPKTLADTVASFLYAYNFDSIKHLEGRCLTVIDSAIADPIQRKAVKDVLKMQFDFIRQKNSNATAFLREEILRIEEGKATPSDISQIDLPWACQTLNPDYIYSKKEK